MRATFEIDAKLVVLLHEVSQQRGVSTSALVEEGIRVVAGVSPPPKSDSSRNRPLPSWPMENPLVDISNREELYATLDSPAESHSLYGNPVKE